MYHPLEIEVLHKHIETLKKQLDERDTTIKKLREELGRSGKTKWVEDNGYKLMGTRKNIFIVL